MSPALVMTQPLPRISETTQIHVLDRVRYKSRQRRNDTGTIVDITELHQGFVLVQMDVILLRRPAIYRMPISKLEVIDDNSGGQPRSFYQPLL